MSVETTLFGTVLQEKVGTIYDHPTTQYEQFIERYYGRHKGSGKSKATSTQAQPQTLITAEHQYVARPNNFMALSAFALFCCFCWPAIIFAITSMIYSAQVDLAWELGHREGAKRASACSRDLGIVAVVTGVLILLLVVVSNLVYAYGIWHH